MPFSLMPLRHMPPIGDEEFLSASPERFDSAAYDVATLRCRDTPAAAAITMIFVTPLILRHEG
jgi:hypothetical protein